MPHDLSDDPHWHEPGSDTYAGTAAWPRLKTPYDEFMESQEIPVVREIGIAKLQELTLTPWARMGGRGSFIQLFGTEGRWGSYVVEVPGAGALNAERHLYEEVFLVLDGRGTTEIWIDGQERPDIFEWQKGSLFSIPMNAHHRLVNSSARPALLLAGTSAPNMFNLLADEEAIFNSAVTLKHRYDPNRDSFEPAEGLEGDPARGLAMCRTNIIPDVFATELYLDNRRTPGYRRVEPKMAGNVFYQYIGQHPAGRYSRGYSPGPSAAFICIGGKGYSYTWPQDLGPTPWKDGHGDEVLRQEYDGISMVSAAPMQMGWFHQHFATGDEPLRLLSWYGPNNHRAQQAGIPGEGVVDEAMVDVTEPGGTSIPYWLEDPHVRQEFAAAIAREGSENRMEEHFYDARTTYSFSGG
ncbi:MAG: cupin domain-containing protein [Rhodospirillaceae bacterium]|nr:cupin domain-containing protein [Rhodospirillaceae bacterium]MBT5455291.1 cupin domain-containing protein [Rhodospirillaceae bacterium]